jgi:pimeloyl-ACP methyl ester carboxylesterase
MKMEADVISVCGKYRIYCEHHKLFGADKTTLMVNGALATTISFTQTIRNLKDHTNVLLFDLPFAGKSRSHNEGCGILTKEDEVEILLCLIEQFKVNYLVSASWGGLSTLLALASRPHTVERAVVLSFSPVINQAMHSYMSDARRFMQDRDVRGGAELLNSTVGRYLPRLLKSHNYEYLLQMIDGNEQQILFHIDQIFSLDHSQYLNMFRAIDIPVLFINGALDEYTTSEDARLLACHMQASEFAIIPDAGHFLDLESSAARRAAGEIKREFLFGNQQADRLMSERSDPGAIPMAV